MTEENEVTKLVDQLSKPFILLGEFNSYNTFYFQSKNMENYNSLFSLRDALKRSHISAVGPDVVHYEFLRQLPKDSFKLLLKIYNNLWTGGKFLDIWRKTAVIPMPKPGKDNSDPQNYRSVSAR